MFWCRYKEHLHVPPEEPKQHHPSELRAEVAAVSPAALKGRYAR
jgi:hypothetical protein